MKKINIIIFIVTLVLISTKIVFSNISYPIRVNNKEIHTDFLTKDESTYIKLRDVMNNTIGINVFWNGDKKTDGYGIDIMESTWIQIIEISGNKYVDITSISNRYLDLNLYDDEVGIIDMPYSFFILSGGLYCIRSTYDDSVNIEFDLHKDLLSENNSLYVPLDIFKEDMYPYLLDIIYENEKFLLDNGMD